MNEHPVPRNVTGFQFQLIGFMTLKQFGYLLAGALVAFVFYSAPLSFFRFPIAAFFLFLGIAFAFFPIQERPLDVWIVNLIRSVYSPTQFVWHKEVVMPDFFTMKASSHHASKAAPVEHQADTKAKLATYLASIAPDEEKRLDIEEDRTLKQVSDLFGQHISVKPVKLPPRQSSPTPLSSIAGKLFARQQPVPTAVKPKPLPVQHTTPPLPKGKVAGMVKTQTEGLGGILIHITNAEDKQIRLLKTDQTGKFATSIPLDPGKYRLTVEDPTARFSFRPITFEVGEEGLHPWLIMPVEVLN